MQPVSRHQCLIYEGAPAPQLKSLSTVIRQKLSENYRCLYMHSARMVTSMQSHLYVGGINVKKQIMNGHLVLSSDNAHLVDGHFDIDRMIGLLEQTLHQALHDGYQGVFATGDMSQEFGSDGDFSQLLEYEWRLEEFLQTHPAFCGICQYHTDTLPHEAVLYSLWTHSSLFINEALSRLNPHNVQRESFAAQLFDAASLDEAIRDLCAAGHRTSAAPTPNELW